MSTREVEAVVARDQPINTGSGLPELQEISMRSFIAIVTVFGLLIACIPAVMAEPAVAPGRIVRSETINCPMTGDCTVDIYHPVLTARPAPLPVVPAPTKVEIVDSPNYTWAILCGSVIVAAAVTAVAIIMAQPSTTDLNANVVLPAGGL